jgi:hypothetical protein
MMRRKFVYFSSFSGLMGLVAVFALSTQAAGVDPDAFRARTTGDLIALCAAQPGSESYVAAINFCQGFATGAYQYYESIAGASASARFICLPDPAPTRLSAIEDFLSWARNKPKVKNERPVDSMFQYLGERYPCNG